jgi:hypothetical protein
MKAPWIFDAFFAVGVVLLFAGIAWIHTPAAVIVVGAILLALGVMLAKAHAETNHEPAAKTVRGSKAKMNAKLRDVGARVAKSADGREVLLPNDYTLDRGSLVEED